ncbi:hypothetical protein [Streptomyces sp. enrichment culture]|uniref:hypothetical protein n=1 Tax=Streptomyces sp. enrichment culture TaxID=1795815 RepID=UPI003F56A5E9
MALLLMRYDGMAVRPLRESRTVWRVPEAVRHGPPIPSGAPCAPGSCPGTPWTRSCWWSPNRSPTRSCPLVEAVSATWGTVPVSGGKQVWAELVTGG